MKWNDYSVLHKYCAKAKGWKLNSKNESSYVRQLQESFIRSVKRKGADDKIGNNTAAHVYSEYEWNQTDRPYYDVYPSVSEAFTKIDLTKIKCEQIRLPISPLMIRFAIGHELGGSTMKARSILVSYAKALITKAHP